MIERSDRHYKASQSPVEVIPVRFAEWRGDLAARYRFWPDARRRWKALPWWGRLGYIALTLGCLAVFALPNSQFMYPVLLNLSGLAVLRRPADPQLAELVPSPLPRDHFPVHVEFSCDGHVYGEDDGMALFEGGWLLFEGGDCSFSVRSSDAKVRRRRGYQEPPSKEDESLPEDELRLELGTVSVRFAPFSRIKTEDGVVHDVPERFRLRVKEWVREPSPHGTPILPPAFSHPRTAGWKRACAWLSVLKVWLFGAVLARAILAEGGTVALTGAFVTGFLTLGLSVAIPMLAPAGHRRLVADLASFRQNAQKAIRPLP